MYPSYGSAITEWLTEAQERENLPVKKFDIAADIGIVRRGLGPVKVAGMVPLIIKRSICTILTSGPPVCDQSRSCVARLRSDGKSILNIVTIGNHSSSTNYTSMHGLQWKYNYFSV